MFRKLSALFFVALSAGAGSLATAQNPNEAISDIFDQLATDDYSTESVRDAQKAFHQMGTPSALSASILISQYETKSPTLTLGLLDQLGDLAKSTNRNIASGLAASEIDGFVALYDGSAASLADALFWLNGQERNKLIDWGHGSPHFSIPCHYFSRHPDIGRFTKRVGAYRHRWAFPSLDIDCNTNPEFITAHKNIFDFWEAGKQIAVEEPSCGTIYRDHAAGRKASLTRLFYRPEDIRKPRARGRNTDHSFESLKDTALYDWALVGRQNYRRFLELEKLHINATEEMVAYYNDQFEYSDEAAREKASYALLSQIHGASRQPSFSKDMDKSLKGIRGIRGDILSGAEVTQEQLLHAKQEINMSNTDRTGSFAGVPEPLAHIAMGRAELLKAMIELGFSVEKRDALGKTPLMVAAQENDLTAVALLLSAGADVNAKSYHPKDIEGNSYDRGRWQNCGRYNVSTGERTALNYAVSEASEDVIKLLIKSGAGVDGIDSSGNTVLDYIDGTGPTPKNSKLSDAIRIFILDGQSAGLR